MDDGGRTAITHNRLTFAIVTMDSFAHTLVGWLAIKYLCREEVVWQEVWEIRGEEVLGEKRNTGHTRRVQGSWVDCAGAVNQLGSHAVERSGK